MKRLAILGFITILMTGGMFTITGCVEKKGPVQRAGENIDRAVENMKDAVDPPGPAEKAGRKVDRAVDDLTRN
jgi:hypothetical protein